MSFTCVADPPTLRGHLGCSHFHWCERGCFQFWVDTQAGITGPHGDSVFNFFRDHHTVLHSDRTILYSYLQGNRGRDGWMASLTHGREFEQTQGDGEGTGKPGGLQSMGSQRVGHNLATEQQQPLPKCSNFSTSSPILFFCFSL